jgi:hypothetical protein
MFYTQEKVLIKKQVYNSGLYNTNLENQIMKIYVKL